MNHEAFYSTCAQTVPFLLLALILDARAPKVAWQVWQFRWSVRVVLVAVLVAEALSLYALTWDLDSPTYRWVVSSAWLCAFGGLIGFLVVRTVPSLLPDD